MRLNDLHKQTVTVAGREYPKNAQVVKKIDGLGHPTEFVTVDDALSMLSGFGGSEPATQLFLRTGRAGNGHCLFVINPA